MYQTKLKYLNSVYSGRVNGIHFGGIKGLGLGNAALILFESENRKQLRFNCLRFLMVPRIGTQPCNYKKIKEFI